MDRPARVQCSKSELESKASERHAEHEHELGTSAVFNIWHRKWAGGNKTNSRFRSPFRCEIARDAGYTKSSGPYFCLWFARGCCYKGKDCEYLHRVPEAGDVAKLDGTNTTDCFGRAKFAEYRDDMGGVGTFLRPSRTLYIGHFKGVRREALVPRIRKQFQEWGPVEDVRLGKNSSIAFVTYKHQMNAEFAKESMSNQTVTGKEVLTVRWSEQSKDKDETFPEERIREIVRNVLKSKTVITDSAHGSIEEPEDVPPPKRRALEGITEGHNV